VQFWITIAWLGNVAFFSRFFVQWLASERAKKSVAPTSFWWLSLCGSLCLGAYTYQVGEPVLLAGHVLNGALFARNLHLSLRPKQQAPAPHPALAVLALAMTAGVIWLSLGKARGDLSETPGWLAVSVLGQSIWSSRFVLQWWRSEATGKSHFPVLFWWISLFGNGLLLAYTSHLGDPALIAGYLPGPLVQARNLMLGHGPQSQTSAPATEDARDQSPGESPLP